MKTGIVLFFFLSLTKLEGELKYNTRCTITLVSKPEEKK